MRRWLASATLLLNGTMVANPEGHAERIFTAGELAALDRENAMWRQVRADAEVPEILQAWRRAGFTAEEVDACAPRLARLWEVSSARHFGWLHEDTVEQLKQVDREFVIRMRAVRLREETGVQLAGYPSASPREVDRQWRQAILRVLDYDEIAEFMLMNSHAAREAVRLCEGIELSADEQRRLFLWHREFDLAHERDGIAPGRSRDPAWREARLDHLAKVQELIGVDRFAIYLGRAEPGFEEMKKALSGIEAGGNASAVEVWWIRQRLELARARQPLLTANNVREADAQAQARVAAVLGEECFRRYAEGDHALWLFSTKRWRVKLPPTALTGPGAR